MQRNLAWVVKMEWLNLLAVHPTALSSLQEFLKQHEEACYRSAFDKDINIVQLKGERDAYIKLQAYIINHKHEAERKSHGMAVQ